jgi:hypothetical protein
MNVPENIAKLFRDRIIISDVTANSDTANRRMTAALGQLTKAQGFWRKRSGRPPLSSRSRP